MLKLYNTLTKKKEVFKPIKNGEVGMYVCGPTVYYYAHIGNFRAYIFADILRRTLEMNGYKVKQVMNLTDVGHLTSDEDEGEDKSSFFLAFLDLEVFTDFFLAILGSLQISEACDLRS